ncbi:MAG: glycosyltransferase [Rhodobacteraceae bacterium]|nr:glycosyltransferase [Paracoccaceae bacterium]
MPDKAPLLTIIVTSYNVEPYIEACLDSITQQTLTDIEIIVVDDGSTDRSPDIVSRYAAQDARIVPIMLPENTRAGSNGRQCRAEPGARHIYRFRRRRRSLRSDHV